MDDCIFCKIVAGDIPAKKYYEDELMIVIAEMTEADAADLGKCIRKIGEIAPSLGLENGFRFIVNQGDDAEQTVFHLHMHLLGGQKLSTHSYKSNAR